MLQQHGLIGEILEEGGTLAKQMGQTIAKTPSDFGKAAVSQITTNGTANPNEAEAKKTDKKEDPKELEKAQKQHEEFIRDLYGLDEWSSIKNTAKEAVGISTVTSQKTPEEQQKIEALRKQLHGTYYQNLIHPPKPPEKPVAEKLEEEKAQEEWELQQKEEKKPKAVEIATHKTEQYRGSGG